MAKEEETLNITEVTRKACEEPTLLDALSWICVWESERIVKQARANLQWETCFRVCLQSVIENYRQKRLDKPDREKYSISTIVDVGNDAYKAGVSFERKRIQALYENMSCVPEEDNCYYRFWQALKEKE